jgi:hypothetical protein
MTFCFEHTQETNFKRLREKTDCILFQTSLVNYVFSIEKHSANRRKMSQGMLIRIAIVSESIEFPRH